MKRLAVALILLALLLSVSGYSLWNVFDQTKTLIHSAEQLRQLPFSGSLEESSTAFLRQWERTENQLVLYVNHEKLERISQTAAQLPALARYGDYSSFYSQVDLLLCQLEGLRENALPNYRNLL